MTLLKIIEGILNKKNQINSLNYSCRDNDLLKIIEGILNKKNQINFWTILAVIMILLKIIEGILNKKNQINSLNYSCRDNDSSQNYRRYLKQKESDQ